jgi:hypothetical protein
MNLKFIQDGNISGAYRLALAVFGILLIILPAEYMKSSWLSKTLMLVGLGIAAIGGIASRSHTLGLKPFDNSYKKARASYLVEDDEEKPK